jgi:hypothetical protein
VNFPLLGCAAAAGGGDGMKDQPCGFLGGSLWANSGQNSSTTARHLVADVIDPLDLAHVAMQTFKVGLQHELAADNAGTVSAPLLFHFRRQLFANVVMAASRVSA